MLPIKGRLNPNCDLGGDDVVCRNSRWPYLGCQNEIISDASHQVLAQFDFRLGMRCSLKNFKMAAILDIETEWFWQFWISLRLRCPHQVSARSDLWFGRCRLKNFKMAPMAGHLGYRNGTILSILNLCVTVMLPFKFWLNPTYGLGGDVVWRVSRWPPWPSWLSDRNGFSNSESLCRSDASHQVLAESEFWFGTRCHWKNFKKTAVYLILEPNGSSSEYMSRDASYQVSA